MSDSNTRMLAAVALRRAADQIEYSMMGCFDGIRFVVRGGSEDDTGQPATPARARGIASNLIDDAREAAEDLGYWPENTADIAWGVEVMVEMVASVTCQCRNCLTADADGDQRPRHIDYTLVQAVPAVAEVPK